MGVITVQDCIDAAEKGWFVILHNGQILGFTNSKGRSKWPED